MSVSKSHDTPKPDQLDSTQLFGTVLKTAREAEGLSVGEISDALKLPIETIEHIENTNIDALPPATFTAGYLRSYARFVNVSEDDIVQFYHEQTGDESQQVPLIVTEKPLQATSDHPGMRLVTYVVIAVVVVLFLLWIQGTDDVDNLEQIQSAPVDLSEIMPVDTHTPDIVEEQPLQEMEIQQPELVAIETERMATQPSQPQAELIVAEETQQLIEENSRKANPVAPVGDDTLTLTASHDCWVEISDHNDHLLYFSLLEAGETVQLSGQEPFKVFLGDATAVTLAINQVEYALTDHVRKNNTARFELSIHNARLKQVESAENVQPTDSVEEVLNQTLQEYENNSGIEKSGDISLDTETSEND